MGLSLHHALEELKCDGISKGEAPDCPERAAQWHARNRAKYPPFE